MDQTAVTQTSQLAIQILVPVVIIFATWLAHRLIALLESKLKINVPNSIEDKIDEWVAQGVVLAAEKSHQKLKEKTEKLKGPEKLETAADYVFTLASARGWDTWTKDVIKAKIESYIGGGRHVPENE